MSDRRATICITQNFERNLESIRQFLEEQESSSAYHDLLCLLTDEVIPNLESFPEIGFDFLARVPQSRETLAQVRALQRRLGSETSLREYIARDYLLLYTLSSGRIHLLAIKHHRQLSFDLKVFWRR
jgi:hypothetical protein